jgi:septum site-determining protein MinD
LGAKVYVITSGKGGVGKTITTAAIGAELAKLGHKVVLIDFDIGLRNLDLVMGCERRVIYDFINVLNNEATLSQALIQDQRQENLFILPASQTRTKDALTIEGVGNIIEQLKIDFDFILCDSPSGIEKGALLALYYADEAIIVTNPNISSVRANEKIISILNSHTKLALTNQEVKKHLLINRFTSELAINGTILSIESITDALGINLLGAIPESLLAIEAINNGTPLTLYIDSEIKNSYTHCTNVLLGKKQAITKQEYKGWSFFKRIMRKKPQHYDKLG